ncbi:hypothetical protein [Geodermatophilus sp. SYSU D00815]
MDITDRTPRRSVASWDGAPATDFPADPYPGRRPDGSFLLAGDRVRQVRPGPDAGWTTTDGVDVDAVLSAGGEPGLAERVPVLAYGSNANPAKLAGLRIGPVVALRVTTTGLAAAWCTDPRSDGQIPATLIAAPGAVETHHVLLCTAAQVARLDRVEGRAAGYYDLGVLRTGTVTTEHGRPVDDVLAYVGGYRRQPLAGPTGEPVPVAAVPQAAAARWAAGRPGACATPAVIKPIEVLPEGASTGFPPAAPPAD